jgi:2,4-dienoyl-CoA reductase-like NADH-dependent reductase (Old Yellow Enzyme family)
MPGSAPATMDRYGSGPMSFPNLFKPYQMGNVMLRNRLVMAGHGSRFIDHDRAELSRRQADYLGERALARTL